MALFIGTVVNKVDKKGRVSVPAAFRTALAAQAFPGVVLFPSFTHEAIDGSGMDRMEKLAESIDDFDPFSEEADAFATSILADAHQLSFDPEGRIVLPKELMEHAGISTQVAFVGRGKTFQLWEPEAFKAFQAEMRAKAKEKRDAIRSPNKRQQSTEGEA